MKPMWIALTSALGGAAVAVSALSIAGRKSRATGWKRRTKASAQGASDVEWGPGAPGTRPGGEDLDRPGMPGVRADKGPSETGEGGKGLTGPDASVNDICPVDGRAVPPNAPHRVFRGETLGFCCDQCAQQWDELPAGDKVVRLEQVDNTNP